MSNGTICCALEVCCPPPPEGQNEAQAKALAGFLEVNATRERKLGGAIKDEATYIRLRPLWASLAEAVLADFDLVPKGVGRAIVEAYRPEFEKAARKGGAGEASPNSGPKSVP